MNLPRYWNDAVAAATRSFEDAAYAEKWMETANAALGGAAPKDLLDTSEGWQIVQRELAAVEHGLPL